MEINIIETKTIPTIEIRVNNKKIVFHSKYNPLNEAESWCSSETNLLKSNEDIIIIGIGAGYHVLEVAKLFPNQIIRVIEFNDMYLN